MLRNRFPEQCALKDPTVACPCTGRDEDRRSRAWAAPLGATWRSAEQRGFKSVIIIIPEHRSESYRNRVHLAPDSPDSYKTDNCLLHKPGIDGCPFMPS